MAETDLSDWLTVPDAAAAIGCSPRTIERLGKARTLEQRLRRQEGTPPVAVYNPDDVARIASERRRDPAPFVLPAGTAPPNGNGHHTSDVSPTHPRGVLARRPASEDPIRQLAAAFEQFLLSPPSPPVAESVAETGFLTLAEASAFIRLPQADLRRLVDAGELPVRKTGRGGLRFRRKDLEAL